MGTALRIVPLLMVLSMTLILSGCVFYKTVPVPVNQISLNEYLSKKPFWTIQDSNNRTDIISSVRVGKDSLSGRLSALDKIDHPAHKLTFIREKRGKNPKDFLHLQTSNTNLPEITKIPLSSITSITTHEPAHGRTIFFNTGVFVVGTTVATLAFVRLLEAICNCPYVKIVGADTTHFQGSLFPGAISKSLERSDHLLIRNPPLTKDNHLNVIISNELPEVEFIDHVELFEVTHATHSMLATTPAGELISFDSKNNLELAETPFQVSQMDKLIRADGLVYDFNEEGNDFELNALYLRFKRADLGDKAKLIITAKQSKWVETVAEFFFQQLGSKFPNWVDRIDKMDPQVYSHNMIESGVSLNAYLKQKGKWEYAGSFENAGTLEFRTLAIDLDLTAVLGNAVEIKLEAAHGLWDVDYVGVTDQADTDVHLSKIKMLSAVNKNGSDVRFLIESDNNEYVTQPNQGDYLSLLFEAPSHADHLLVLQANGYYHHKRDYTSKPNYRILKQLKRDKLSTHQLSRQLQMQRIAYMHKTGN